MSMNLTAVSLFAGILTGGIDLALEQSGITVKAAVEIDPDCRAVLRRHFPQTTIFDDVTEVTGEQLLAAGFVPGRGILTAGWPCQGNSVAGRRKGMADPRSGLWRHVVRLLAEARPRWFLGENVAGLLSVNGGRDFGAVLRDLDELGYGVAWRVLDAQFFGVPQRRRRVILAGCLGNGTSAVEVLLEPAGGKGNPPPGFPARADVAGTLGSRAGGSRTTDLDGHGAYVTGALTRGSLDGPDDNTAQAGHLVAHAVTAREGKGPDSDATSGNLVAATIQGGGRRGHRLDAEGAAGGHLVQVPSRDVAQPVTASYGKQPDNSDTGLGPTLVMMGAEGEATPPSRPHPGAEPGGGSYPMIAHTLTSEGADASEDGGGRGTPLVTVSAPGHGGEPTALQASQVTAVAGLNGGEGISHAVRRLTPLECERLMGLPDEWTRHRDDGSEQSDSARYRQCGNSVAVPVIAWVAQRIVTAEK